jgi:hypothetical protein
MQQLSSGEILYSASDVVNFLECEHLLDLTRWILLEVGACHPKVVLASIMIAQRTQEETRTGGNVEEVS